MSLPVIVEERGPRDIVYHSRLDPFRLFEGPDGVVQRENLPYGTRPQVQEQDESVETLETLHHAHSLLRDYVAQLDDPSQHYLVQRFVETLDDRFRGLLTRLDPSYGWFWESESYTAYTPPIPVLPPSAGNWIGPVRLTIDLREDISPVWYDRGYQATQAPRQVSKLFDGDTPGVDLAEELATLRNLEYGGRTQKLQVEVSNDQVIDALRFALVPQVKAAGRDGSYLAHLARRLDSIESRLRLLFP